ncbi:hypothetical protein CYY_005898, partial [Polysphondylium violaceum]
MGKITFNNIFKIFIFLFFSILIFNIQSINCQFAPVLPGLINRNNPVIYKYVSVENGTDSSSCGSVNTPCLTLNYLFENGKVIRNQNTSIQLDQGVFNLYKMVNITGYLQVSIVGVANKTILQGPTRGFMVIATVFSIRNVHFRNFSINGSSELVPIFFPKIFEATFNDFLSYRYLTNAGGAFFLAASIVRFDNCQFSHCLAKNGGATFQISSNITYSGCYFFENSADAIGGAIAHGYGCSSQIENSTFISNNANQGGAVFFIGTRSRIKFSNFFYNYALTGGAIQIFNASFIGAVGCNFTQNLSDKLGGAVYIQNAFGLFSHSIYIENKSLVGGVFSVSDNAAIYVAFSIFRDNLSILGALLDTNSDLPMQFDGNFVENTKYLGEIQSMFSLSNARVSVMFKDNLIMNLNVTFFNANSLSILGVINSTFIECNGKIVNFYNQASAFFLNTKFINSTSLDSIIVLRNGATGYFYNCIFLRNKAVSIFVITNSADSLFYQNFFQECETTQELIILQNRYNMDIHFTTFRLNVGDTRGGVLFSDDTGKLQIYNSSFISNTCVSGCSIYYGANTLIASTCNTSHYCSNSFLNNFASNAGSVAYYSNNISCPIRTCDRCFSQNNTAIYGDLVNSVFHTFQIIEFITQVETNSDFSIKIMAMDRFKHVFRGSNAVRFTVHPCKEIYVTGVLSGTLYKNGLVTLHGLKANQFPGVSCNLTVTSDPQSQAVPLLIQIANCSDDRQAFKIYANNTLFMCMKVVKIDNIAKVVLVVIGIFLAIVSAIFFVITIYHRNKKVVRYTNPIFLIIVLVADVILLASLFCSITVSDIMCILRSLFVLLGLSILLTVVVVKQYKLWQLFKFNDYLKDTNIDTRTLLRLEGILLIIPIICIGVCLGGFRFKEKYVFNLEQETATHQCYSKHYYYAIIPILFYLGIILIFGCYICVKSRKFRSAPGTFYESYFNSLTIYNLTAVFVCIVPLCFALRSTPTTYFLVLNIGICVNVLVSLILLFVPKLNFLLRKDAIVTSLRKVIEDQERDIEKNKEMLAFYGMYLDEENKGYPPTIPIHETFSSEDSSSTYSSPEMSVNKSQSPILESISLSGSNHSDDYDPIEPNISENLDINTP